MSNRTLSQVINNAENNDRLQNFQLSEKSIIVIPNLNMITTEALTMIEKSDVIRDDHIHVTNSASWSDISPELRQELKASGKRFSPDQSPFEIREQDIEMPPDFSHICGICMTGNSPFATITNHDPGAKQSVLFQVSEIFDIALTKQQSFIAAYEVGGVKAMERLGAEYYMDDNEVRDMIQNVLAYDRQTGPGAITPEEELQTEQAIANMEIKDQNLAVVHLPHDGFQSVTDRLYDQYDNILIISDTGSSYLYSGNDGWDTLAENMHMYDNAAARAANGVVYDSSLMHESQAEFNQNVFNKAKDMSLQQLKDEISYNSFYEGIYNFANTINNTSDPDQLRATSDTFTTIVDVLSQAVACSADTLIEAFNTEIQEMDMESHRSDTLSSLPEAGCNIIRQYYKEHFDTPQHSQDEQIH